MNEDLVREIAQKEVERHAALVMEELAMTPTRADGNINAKDLYDALARAYDRYVRGEVVSA